MTCRNRVRIPLLSALLVAGIPFLGLPAVAQTAAPAKVAPKHTTTPKATATKAVPAIAMKTLPAPVKVTSVEGITEYHLANGLRVLLFPDPSKPSITTNITYLVGSRNESYGETGMAHLLEHLVFKPSKHFGEKKGTPTPVEVLNSLGARFNGSTWFDRTNYFVTFPASDANLTKILELEADRMVNALIRKSDLWDEKTQKGEMTVVRNEMEGGENNPVGVTTQRMESVAFDWHNYGKSTIGARSDVEHVNIEHLQAFYHRFYQPDNAVLLVAGKIDEAKVLAEINERFGRIPKPARVIEKTWTIEPTQDGERSVTVRRVGGTPFLGLGYHIPASSNIENDAVGFVASILTAAPSGRLYKALVDSKLASSVSDQSVTTLEPSFLEFHISLPKDGNLDAVKDAALKVVEGFKEKPVTTEELERVKAEALKGFQLSMNRTDALAIALSEAMAAGDWRLYFIGRDRAKSLTLAQVQAAAEKYLKASNRTLGQYIPTEKPDRAEIPAALDIAAMVKDYKGQAPIVQGEAFDSTPANIENHTVRFTAPNGMKGALLSKKTKGQTVSAALTLRFGTEASLTNLGAVPSLTGSMLMRGSTSHSRQQLKDAFDQMKAQVNINGGAESARVNITADREHLPAVLKLVAEVLRQPAFPAEELATLRDGEITGLDQSKSEPQTLAVIELQSYISPFAKDHPRAAHTPDESIADLKKATPADLKAFHDGFYGADNATLAVVGDFDAKEIQALTSQLFGEWKSGQAFARIHAQRKDVQALNKSIETPDKAQAFFIAAETMPMKDSDPDYAAFLIANQMLGGGALKSRLADRIRQKEGLSYGVGSQFQADPLDPVANWFAFAIYAPENVVKLEAAFQDELKKALTDGYTSEELAFAKNAWQQGRSVGRTQDGAVAGQLSTNMFLGRTMAFDESLEKQVQALTLDQVNAAFRKHFSQDKVSIVKAGDFAKATKK